MEEIVLYPIAALSFVFISASIGICIKKKKEPDIVSMISTVFSTGIFVTGFLLIYCAFHGQYVKDHVDGLSFYIFVGGIASLLVSGYEIFRNVREMLK